MSTLWDVPAADLVPGDVIRTDKDDITVTGVEALPADAESYPGGYRVKGRITRGYGRGKRVLSWCYHGNHVFPTIIRGDP